MNDKNLIINVGRQLGSGGRSIARLLADEFACKFYDRELLNLAAKESGFSEKFFEQNDENKGFLKSRFHIHIPYMPGANCYNDKFSQESLFQFQSDAIRKAADAGSCVFVGRCADYVLRDYRNVVNIFITADTQKRIERIAERHACDAKTAERLVNSIESGRSSYYNYYTGKRWGFSDSYDLCINSSLLGIKETARYLADFIRKRMQRL